MERIGPMEALRKLKKRLPVENVFSILLIVIAIVLWFISLLTDERTRIINDTFIHYFIIAVFVAVGYLQVSLRIKINANKKIKFKNIKPPRHIQQMIRNSIMGVGNETAAKPQQIIPHLDKGSPERDNFYTPRMSFGQPVSRFDRNVPRRSFGDESFFSNRDFKGGLETPYMSEPTDFYNLGDERKHHTPLRRYDSSTISQFTLGGSRRTDFDRSRFSKYGYSELMGRPRETPRSVELPDFKSVSELKEEYHNTIEKLQIKNKMKYWLANTQNWIHKKIIRNLVELDLKNLEDLASMLSSRAGFNLVFMKSEGHSSSRSPIIPREYEKRVKYYYNERNQDLDMRELLEIEIKQDLVGQLYGKYYYSLKGKYLFEASEKYRKAFETLLEQRKELENYFTVEGFCYESRFYVFNRILKWTDTSDFDVRYNSGISFAGAEWNQKLPTDSQVIMSVFCAYFQRLYKDGSEHHGIIRILYDYMDYHPKYSHGNDTLIIVQVAPHSYAPHYKVRSGEEDLNCYPGKENVFNAILFFLHQLKTKKNCVYGVNHKPMLEEILKY